MAEATSKTSSDLLEEVLEADRVELSEEGSKEEELSIEALILMINAERLKFLEEKMESEFASLKERQERVAELHKILKAINEASNSKGELDIGKNEELKKLLERANELGADVNPEKTKYNKEERERLVENIRMTVEDLGVQNDMQLQKVSRLTNERYESYQMAKGMMKVLHDSKTTLAKAIRG